MSDEGRKTPVWTLVVTGLSGVVFLIVGAALFLSFDGIERLAGLAFGVMGGIGLIIGLGFGVTGSRRPPDRAAKPTIPPAGSTVVYQRSRSGYIDVAVGVGAAIFVSLFLVIGLALMGAGEPAGGGFALIAGAMWLLIVPATVVGLIRLATDRTILALDPAGVRIFGIGWIPWGDIDRMSIEDTSPLVSEPGTTVIGSMRQLAFELRPGAIVPEGNAVDRAMRGVSKGFLALGQAAGRGRYHWLAVRERDIGLPLDEVLDVASVYHARVVGIVPETSDATTDGPDPAAASAEPVTKPEGSASAGLLAAEAAAIRSARSVSHVEIGEGTIAGRALALVGLGIAIAATMAFLGRGLVTSFSAGPLPPWQFIVFALVTGGLQFGYRAARRRSSWMRRPLGAAIALSIGAFVLGASSATWLAPSPVPAPVVAAVMASSEMPEHPMAHAVDRIDRNMWNSGRGAPAWIRLDLKEPARVTAVRLLVEQTPPGRTVHRLYVLRDAEAFDLVFEFDGTTSSGQWLSFRPESSIDGVRSIVIQTVESPSWVAWREIEVE